MIDYAPQKVWMKRLLYLVLCFVLIFLHLLPLDTTAFRDVANDTSDLLDAQFLRPARWAGPDLMLAFTIAWVRRRPSYVPPLLIAFVFLLADLLFQQPPGLMTLIVLLACEIQRNKTASFRTQTFPNEWFNAAFIIAGVALAQRLVLGVMLSDQVPLGLHLMQVVMTIVAYPLVVFISQVIFGVRKASTKDINAIGGGV
ncbi:rod shape-determining protein MreD [Roseovarius sp. EL26]|uniref:rod shape-determining protein MreD n=1 Tax=Roseovarius sp. EL26 TaxID=2126672 RepID=UPI000EA3BAB7|nr:rod shape-determining protein MreD [Roseovarius sp. EL26]